MRPRGARVAPRLVRGVPLRSRFSCVTELAIGEWRNACRVVRLMRSRGRSGGGPRMWKVLVPFPVCTSPSGPIRRLPVCGFPRCSAVAMVTPQVPVCGERPNSPPMDTNVNPKSACATLAPGDICPSGGPSVFDVRAVRQLCTFAGGSCLVCGMTSALHLSSFSLEEAE